MAKFFALLAIVALSSPYLVESATYQLEDHFGGTTFFDNFQFFVPSWDTGDFTVWVNRSTAEADGLVNTTDEYAYIGTNYKTVSSDEGRVSVRLESNNRYDEGLFVLSLGHMPWGCGTHVAYWLDGPDWPNNGEIDIIEGINVRTDDQTTLHTNLTCGFSPFATNNNMTGKWATVDGEPYTNCSSTHSSNHGCAIYAENSNSYGDTFNDNGGGMFVVEWGGAYNGLRMFFFKPKDVPQDILDGNPDPTTWGIPYANYPFGSWCPASHFDQQTIIISMAFCGGWVDSDFKNSNTCMEESNGQSCEEFVQYNPSYFQDAYWKVYYIDVYKYM